MTNPESPKPLRSLNSMERQRFVDAVRNLLHTALYDDEYGPDLYGSAVHRLDSGIVTLTESEPLDDAEFHEVSVKVERLSGAEVLPLQLKYTSRYSVNPSLHTSSFSEKVEPLVKPEVPLSDEAFAQKLVDSMQPDACTFSPERLAVVLPLVAQCNRGNLIATTSPDQ